MPEDGHTLHDALLRGQRLLAVRERTRGELLSRLVKAGFEEDVASQAVDILVQDGLLSDARFADTFIRSKLSAGWGSNRIALELKRHGIDIDTVPGWPDDYLEEDEYGRAMEVLAHSSLHSKNIRQAAYRRLMSRGFSHDVSYRAARDFTQEDPGTL